MAALVRLLVRRPGLFLGCFLLVLITAILVSGRLRFNQDILSLIPKDDASFQVLSHILKVSEGENRLYILLQKEESSSLPAKTAESVAKQIEELTLDGRPAFESVTALKTEAVSPGEFEQILDDFLHSPRLFLKAAEVEDIQRFLRSPKALEDALARSLALMAAPGASRLGRLAAMDPLNFRKHLIPKLHSLYSRLEFAQGEHLLAPDRQAALLVAMPSFSPGKTDQARRLLEQVKDLEKEHPGLSFGLTGGFAIAVQEKSLMKKDFLGCLLGSALLVTFLFLLTYRRLTVLFFVLLPLGVGLQLAMGVMAVIWGQVHLISVAFSAVVLGLGIDFAIHLFDRYVLERSLGEQAEQAVSRAVLRTGRAVAMGGLTTLSAFLVLAFTDSPVLQQIGWLVSLGLLFCLGTILLALPAWLIFSQRFSFGRSVPRLRLLGLGRPAEWIHARPGSALIIALAVLILTASGLPELRFETDLASLHPKDVQALDVQRDIQRHFGSAGETALLVWPAEDPSQLRSREGQAVSELRKLTADGDVLHWTSLSSFTGLTSSPPGDLDTSTLRTVLSDFGFALEDFPATAAFLHSLSAWQHGPAPDMCPTKGEIPEILQRFVLCQEQGGMIGITWVQTAGQKATDRMSQALSSIDGLRTFDLDSALGVAREKIRSELIVTASLAALAILALLWLYFRKVRLVCLALLPTCLGLAATFGLMGHLGMSLNPVNFVLLPILLGIGLDDGIHVITRYLELGELRGTLRTTGRSILMTTLTTSLGFGSLVLAKYHVLTQMGLLAIIGVASAFFFTATALGPVLTKALPPADRKAK